MVDIWRPAEPMWLTSGAPQSGWVTPGALALSAVLRRWEANSELTVTEARTVMGALGLSGEKSVREIGHLRYPPHPEGGGAPPASGVQTAGAPQACVSGLGPLAFLPRGERGVSP